ncbi:hypothetical protein DVH24_032875 [Malus domestica]|uniref:Uncharacterized protein n=1 Tax=Malus domestica TaxID=3750 RepID=A0A498IT13_MALDO|nr:hypothetical protein DVH24_032875 [Malus domestica]
MEIDGSGAGCGHTGVRRKKIEDVICLQTGLPLTDKKNSYAIDFAVGHGNGGSKLCDERLGLALKSSRDATIPTADAAAMLFFFGFFAFLEREYSACFSEKLGWKFGI